jgi:hypothetical protein
MNNTYKSYMDKLKFELGKESLSSEEENELWEKIKQKNKAYQRKKRLRILTFSTGIAASIALLCVWGWYREKPAIEENINIFSSFTPITQEELHSTDVQLLLFEDKKLTISNNDPKIDYQNKGVVKIDENTLDIEEKKQPELNRLIVPAGKRASLLLSDGTKMWINSGSQVIFPVQFTGKQREIFLEGEIFLEVNHNKDIPFIVKTKEIDITVLGTRFNVSTLENKQSSEVVLVSGKVEITTKSQVKSILSPNELFVYDPSCDKSVIRKVDVADHIAWIDGYYQFGQQHMDRVLEKIARYYGIQIKWNDGVKYLTCSGKLDLKDNPEEIFYILKKAAPIEVEKQGEEYLVKIKPKKQ